MMPVMGSMQITELTRHLAKHEDSADYLAVIEGVRELITLNPETVKDPWIKGGSGAVGVTCSCKRP